MVIPVTPPSARRPVPPAERSSGATRPTRQVSHTALPCETDTTVKATPPCDAGLPAGPPPAQDVPPADLSGPSTTTTPTTTAAPAATVDPTGPEQAASGAASTASTAATGGVLFETTNTVVEPAHVAPSYTPHAAWTHGVHSHTPVVAHGEPPGGTAGAGSVPSVPHSASPVVATTASIVPPGIAVPAPGAAAPSALSSALPAALPAVADTNAVTRAPTSPSSGTLATGMGGNTPSSAVIQPPIPALSRVAPWAGSSVPTQSLSQSYQPQPSFHPQMQATHAPLPSGPAGSSVTSLTNLTPLAPPPTAPPSVFVSGRVPSGPQLPASAGVPSQMDLLQHRDRPREQWEYLPDPFHLLGKPRAAVDSLPGGGVDGGRDGPRRPGVEGGDGLRRPESESGAGVNTDAHAVDITPTFCDPYSDAQRTLWDMGFRNQRLNIELLARHVGHIQDAVDELTKY